MLAVFSVDLAGLPPRFCAFAPVAAALRLVDAVFPAVAWRVAGFFAAVFLAGAFFTAAFAPLFFAIDFLAAAFFPGRLPAGVFGTDFFFVAAFFAMVVVLAAAFFTAAFPDEDFLPADLPARPPVDADGFFAALLRAAVFPPVADLPALLDRGLVFSVGFAAMVGLWFLTDLPSRSRTSDAEDFEGRVSYQNPLELTI